MSKKTKRLILVHEDLDLVRLAVSFLSANIEAVEDAIDKPLNETAINDLLTKLTSEDK